MTCPYLREVAMVFCRACPVKKLVPIDHVTTASRCEGEAFKTCPLFREAMARTYGAALEEDGLEPPASPAGTDQRHPQDQGRHT